MSVGGTLSFKIGFLRAMAPTLTHDDLDSFHRAVVVISDDDCSFAEFDRAATVVEELYNKFNKPREA
jgi:hypothetical protein